MTRFLGHSLRGAVLVSVALATSTAATAVAPKAAWTVMVYLDANNDLERPLIKNLEEMLAVGSTSAVNVIVLAARHPGGDGKYTNKAVANLPNWTSAKLLRVEKNRLRELADWGAVDMGDPAQLTRLMQDATRDFPADRYGLIIGDHGMDWAGVAVDELASDVDNLSLDEVAAAFKQATKATGRFELIGFDACLMGNLEVARTLAPYARYLVASEEIEPADGWNYAPLLTALTRTPSMDGATLGRTIVDTYRDYFSNSPHHEVREKANAITLGVIDLDRIAAVDQAVAALGTTLGTTLARGGHAAWVRVARARNEAEEYARTGAVSGAAPAGSEVHDLVHLAANLKAQLTDKATVGAADAVATAVGAAVIYSIHGEARPRASGLSVFFPPDQDTLNVRGKTGYNETGFAQANRWFPFLTGYTAVMASDQERNRPKPPLDPVTASGRSPSARAPVSLVSQVHADDVDEANFVLALNEHGERVVMGSIPVELDAAGDLKEEWDGRWFTLTDQELEFVAPITSFEELSDENGEDVYWAAVPAQLRMIGTHEWVDVTLSFLLDFKGEEVSGDFIYAVQYSKHGPREIELEDGDDLRPVYETIDAAGKQRLSVPDNPADVLHVHDVDDLKVGRSAVPAGRYQVGFAVRNLEGKHSERFVDVDIK